jgi:hypothetical protein
MFFRSPDQAPPRLPLGWFEGLSVFTFTPPHTHQYSDFFLSHSALCIIMSETLSQHLKIEQPRHLSGFKMLIFQAQSNDTEKFSFQ